VTAFVIVEKIKECPYTLKFSSLSPESWKTVRWIWQVFWLRAYFNAFPLY